MLLFNVGVEIGQLIFVAVVLAVLFGLRHLLNALKTRVRPAHLAALQPVQSYGATYAIGICAAFWFFERLHTFIA